VITPAFKLWTIRITTWLFFVLCLCAALLPEHYFFDPTGDGNDEKLMWYLAVPFIALLIIYIFRRGLKRSLEVEVYYGVCITLVAILLAMILFVNIFFSDFSPRF